MTKKKSSKKKETLHVKSIVLPFRLEYNKVFLFLARLNLVQKQCISRSAGFYGLDILYSSYHSMALYSLDPDQAQHFLDPNRLKQQWHS